MDGVERFVGALGGVVEHGSVRCVSPSRLKAPPSWGAQIECAVSLPLSGQTSRTFFVEFAGVRNRLGWWGKVLVTWVVSAAVGLDERGGGGKIQPAYHANSP